MVLHHSRMVDRELKIQIPDDQAHRLDRLAHKLERTSSSLAASAIGEFLDLQDAAAAEIEAGVREAEGGLFASDDEVANVIRKYCLDRAG
jgi:RHH-type rel operon transcriptional repressor/antitoxin RelB